MSEAARDRQVAIETVRDPADCPACRPGEQHNLEAHLQEVNLRGRLDFILRELQELDGATVGLKHIEDFDTLLELHHEVLRIVKLARKIAGGFQDRAWAQRGERWGDYPHPLLGVVSVRRTAKATKWDHETAASRVVDAHMEKTGGELPDPDSVARWLLEAASVNYWRVGVLKDLGVDPDAEELRYKTSGNPAIDYPSMKD